MRFGVIGRTGMLLQTIDHLVDRGHQLAFVATAKGAPEYSAQVEDFRVLAGRHGVPFFQTLKLAEPSILGAMTGTSAEVVVSVNWPLIFNRDVVDAFPHKVINCHGSALPKYRGNACPNWAILNGDRRVGATFHVVDPDGLDTGPIIHQEFLNLTDETYIGDIYDWLHAIYPTGFATALDILAEPGFHPREQDHAQATRAYPRRPEDGRIDFRSPSEGILRLVRASSRPFGGAFCFFEGDARTVVWRASRHKPPTPIYAIPGQVMHYEEGCPVVATSDGAVRFDEFEIDGVLDRSVRKRFL